MKKIRGFELISELNRKGDFAKLPVRGSKDSAGYDFYLPEDVHLHPGESTGILFTNVKAYMLSGENLDLHIRSSVGIKYNVVLSNVTGIIDMDYYGNQNNEGNIGIALVNLGKKIVSFKKGDRIMQGIFRPFLVSDNCNSEEERQGGYGSTNKKVCNNCDNMKLVMENSKTKVYWCVRNPNKPFSLNNINTDVHNCTEHKLK
jgi:dUTP pyrophosphatase